MVDTSKINEWLQVVGMFGVIASLIFVGLQMKQTQQIALSGTYQARSDATVESLTSVINSPEFLSASAKIYANKSNELTMQEAVTWEYYLGAEMTMFENNHQQYEMGFFSSGSFYSINLCSIFSRSVDKYSASEEVIGKYCHIDFRYRFRVIQASQRPDRQ